MKTCLQCGHENEDNALFCQGCHHRELASTGAEERSLPETKTGPQCFTAVTEGKFVTLKCRTPGEAFLVSKELEDSDILAFLPDKETMMREFRQNGFVSIRVSAQAYGTAKELQSVIEYRHWKDRADAPLSVVMIVVAAGLGLMFCPGCVFYFMVNEAHKNRGFRRKAKTFRLWFLVGIALFFVLMALVSSSGLFGH